LCTRVTESTEKIEILASVPAVSLLGKSEPPKQRVQVCVECGMPVADHKQWCSILAGQNEMKLKASEKKTA
jgi:hypothetical protein